MVWIPRTEENSIKQLSKSRPALLLTGARQTGKSSLLQRLFPDAEYLTLDHPLIAEEAESNPTSFLGRLKGQTILDEIQYAPRLFRELKILIDVDRHNYGKWILTGSQKFTLMKGVSESLAGRIGILELDTLSALELRNKGLLDASFVWKGGFPEVWSQNLDPSVFYRDYTITYLERDLRSILEVSSLRSFNRFLRACAIRAGNILNYSDLGRDAGVTSVTAHKWFDVLIATGIITILEPYYANLGKRFVKSPKLFFRDHGLLCSLLNINSMESYSSSLYKGAIWENLVFCELLKTYGAQKNGQGLFFWRDNNNVEVDFLLEQGESIYLIEAKSTERPHLPIKALEKVASLLEPRFRVFKSLACLGNLQQTKIIGSTILFNPLLKLPEFFSDSGTL